MREWFARREMYKQTVRELNCMSDRELDDLGIPRCDIPRIAEESTNRLHDRRG
ncbi:MAG: DUF1127 domain-containing protein [Geminicoccaceae bacterium]|nr:DUF1127 domain-containing protein [Geminicoccaceae bacterium]